MGLGFVGERGPKRAVFLGSKALGLAVFDCIFQASPELTWTVIHPDDSTDPRSVISEFRKLVGSYGVQLVMTKSAEDAKHILGEIHPDIGFVCGWYWLLGSETIAAVPVGLWGVHNSLLPKYRGGAPLVWAIINGDELVGSTVFKMSPGMDDGDILYQVAVHLEASEDVSDALRKLQFELLSQLPHKWLELLSNRAKLVVQQHTQATYCGQRIEADGNIDWYANATSISNFVRAQAWPYPGAFSFLGATRIMFEKCRPFVGEYFGTPGQILRRTPKSIFVACGQNTAVEILSISVDGNSRNPPEIVKSIRGRFSKEASTPTFSEECA